MSPAPTGIAASPRARFIAIEGLDGSGGTTQLALLKQAFDDRAEAAIVTREPSDRPVGRLIREHLHRSWKDCLGDGVFPYLFAADRRDHLDSVVLPALARGESVLSDRYALSSFAYQAAAHGLDRVMRLNQDFPAPDLTIMLDLPPEACLERILARGQPRDRFEALDQLLTIAAGYEAAIAAVRRSGAAGPGAAGPGRAGPASDEAPAPWNIVRIDASGDPASIAAAVRAAVWPTIPADPGSTSGSGRSEPPAR